MNFLMLFREIQVLIVRVVHNVFVHCTAICQRSYVAAEDTFRYYWTYVARDIFCMDSTLCVVQCS